MPRIVKIWIDIGVCLTDGFCEIEAPAVFQYDEETIIPWIAPDIDGLYAKYDAEIREAVNICPYEAIHIEEIDDGPGTMTSL